MRVFGSLFAASGGRPFWSPIHFLYHVHQGLTFFIFGVLPFLFVFFFFCFSSCLVELPVPAVWWCTSRLQSTSPSQPPRSSRSCWTPFPFPVMMFWSCSSSATGLYESLLSQSGHVTLSRRLASGTASTIFASHRCSQSTCWSTFGTAPLKSRTRWAAKSSKPSARYTRSPPLPTKASPVSLTELVF